MTLVEASKLLKLSYRQTKRVWRRRSVRGAGSCQTSWQVTLCQTKPSNSTKFVEFTSAAHPRCLGSNASCNASVSTLKASTRTNMNAVAAPICQKKPVTTSAPD
jgi:hypothetical protein